MAPEPLLAERLSMVGHDDDQSIVIKTAPAQGGNEAANLLVDISDAAVVLVDLLPQLGWNDAGRRRGVVAAEAHIERSGRLVRGMRVHVVHEQEERTAALALLVQDT